MIGWGTGYGKLLLFGEHAAVHGHPAVGLAMPLETQVWIGTNPPETRLDARSRSFQLGSWQIHGMLPQHHQVFGELWKRLLQEVPAIGSAPTRGDKLHTDLPRQAVITSSVPYEMGFGSSGSLSTALVQAGSRYAGTEASAEWLWTAANSLEQVFHGTPSGIDTGLAVFGGCQGFLRKADQAGLPRRIPLQRPQLPLLVGSIPRTRTTRQLVAAVHQRLADEPHRTKGLLQELGNYADSAITHIQDTTATPPFIGRLASQAQVALGALGVSTAELDTLFSELEQLGALGSKLSGAGGGGLSLRCLPIIHSLSRRQWRSPGG